MHKNRHRINTTHISDEAYNELSMQPDGVAQLIVDAVVQYNKMLPLSDDFEGKDVNERLIQEAEEESAKVFLDGILDIMQRGNGEGDFFR